MNKYHYRGDIEGLRSLAIIPVVFFHGEFSMFFGGYVGVDVLFVISGYLITSIITREIKEGRSTITSFCERRIRRIFPALFFAMAVSTDFYDTLMPTNPRLANRGADMAWILLSISGTRVANHIGFAFYSDCHSLGSFSRLLQTW
jgi:peptidoglycan/LPS O-acetylase OafA/YrhL